MKQRKVTNYGISLQEAKDYCHQDINDDDNLFQSLISASFTFVSNQCNRDFVPTYYKETVQNTSIMFLASQDIVGLNTGSIVKTPAGYYASFDHPYTGEVTYTASVSETIPEPIIGATKMLLLHWYDNRGTTMVGASVAGLDFTLEAICDQYKIVNPSS